MAERTVAWKPRGQNQLIGKKIPRIDGIDKASGAAKYSADINTPGTLFGKVLTCPHAHAKVVRLDLTAAEKMPGVRAVHAFAQVGQEVRYDGWPIAAVAAERPEIAEDALRAIKVKYEVLEHWVDEEDLEGAKQAGRTKDTRRRPKGDVDAAFQSAKAVHEGYYGLHTVTHCCLERHGSHAEWKGEKELNVHLSTQNVSGTAPQYAKALQLDAANVAINCEYIGGGFGSKFSVDQWDIACAIMAKKAGRPVRLLLDRATELKIAGNRPSVFAKIKVAADADGKVVAWDSYQWGTRGVGGGNVSLSVIPYLIDDVPNKRQRSVGIRTDCGSYRAWRAPNHPQGCYLTICALDDLAAKLGEDPLQFFLRNLDRISKEHLRQTFAGELKRAAELIGWKEKWHPRGQGGDGPIKRGLGLSMHTWPGRAHQANCTLRIYPDGTVESLQGSQDLGTGTRTVIAITVAETLGLPLSAVNVRIGSNKYPFARASGGSTTVGGVSGPNRRAALQALWKIFDLVAAKYEVDADSLEARGGKIWSNGKVVCSWKQAASLIGPMPLEFHGEGPKKDGLTSEDVGGVQMADVLVDTETGLIRINRFVAVQDCGLIIDELTARSQVMSGMTLGIAYALSEERIMDRKTGRFINADLENYKLPRIGDIGELVVEMYQPDSEYARGVVGLGEPPVISPGAAISNAVANAIGVRVPVLPLTPQRVLDALKGGVA
ncbi:MAG: xanthine dehydrogenase family protein molybdopterin-binding subunit [Planctomycetes bacterium]|nr:xanthine dehydrogenase family protein molybdopterin-binding subunit [Planctomycetota bacterium]